MFKTLDYSNELIQKVYQSGSSANILIKKNNGVKNRLCYIYCSSNNLYKKDIKEDFVAKIIKADRYEWLNRSAETKPAKEIFLRDIWLSWYVLGVNSTINSFDKLIHYLRKEAEGYEVVTVIPSIQNSMEVLVC